LGDVTYAERGIGHAKMAEPIELPFGMVGLSGIGSRIRVLHGLAH